MAGITFEELIAYVGISADELNKPCSDEHITSISLFLANWQTVAPLLGLSETDEEDVEEEGKKTQDYADQFMYLHRPEVCTPSLRGQLY